MLYKILRFIVTVSFWLNLASAGVELVTGKPIVEPLPSPFVHGCIVCLMNRIGDLEQRLEQALESAKKSESSES